MKQYDDGYLSARENYKAKMLTAGLDPSILDSSDELSKIEDDPPNIQ